MSATSGTERRRASDFQRVCVCVCVGMARGARVVVGERIKDKGDGHDASAPFMH